MGPDGPCLVLFAHGGLHMTDAHRTGLVVKIARWGCSTVYSSRGLLFGDWAGCTATRTHALQLAGAVFGGCGWARTMEAMLSGPRAKLFQLLCGAHVVFTGFGPASLDWCRLHVGMHAMLKVGKVAVLAAPRVESPQSRFAAIAP